MGGGVKFGVGGGASESSPDLRERRMKTALESEHHESRSVGTRQRRRQGTVFMAEPPPPDENAMVRAAVADLEDQFGDVDTARIEETVRKHLDKRFAQARVKTYVGIFAERDARAELRATS
jgi:hypothetical protein